MGLPVLNSVILNQSDNLDNSIKEIKGYIKSDYCIVRFVYLKPNSCPRSGGFIIPITYEAIKNLFDKDCDLWLLTPIKRHLNRYGINVFFDKRNDIIKIELVGRGFDTSDINRGLIIPHQLITLRYPIEKGYYNEWWKYISISICSNDIYSEGKEIRKKRLLNMDIKYDESNFDSKYIPLSYEMVEKLIQYMEIIDEHISDDSYVVSCSIDQNNKFVFWDIQTYSGKRKAFL